MALGHRILRRGVVYHNGGGKREAEMTGVPRGRQIHWVGGSTASAVHAGCSSNWGLQTAEVRFDELPQRLKPRLKRAVIMHA